MGILDGIVEWIAEQIMYGLDLINTSVLGALGCDMNTFLRYFPAAKTMYSLLVALAIGLILLGWVWNLFKNYGLGLGIEAEDPVRLTAKAILFIVLAYYADEIVNIALTIGGTPYDGYLYTWAYTTKVEHPYLESKTVMETVTVNTAKNDLAQILAELSPSMPYEKDGFSGELALDHTTLSTEASGYTTKYSKTTETKVIGNLDRNDMSYVPATTVKNGKTLSLANVEWQVTGTALVGEALVPAQYQAVATYSASNSYQAATGYVTTAEYHGTVTAEGVDSITYTVVYTGSEIVPEKTYIWDNGSLSAPLLILTALLLCAGIAAAALILLRRRKNVYVYVPDSKPREYRLIAKFRVEPDSEVPAIDAGSLTLNPGDTVAVEVKKSLARHLAGREFTVSFPQSDHTYTIQSSKHNDWHEFTVPAEEEQEAPV